MANICLIFRHFEVRRRETLAEEHHAVLETIQEQSDFSSDDQDDDFVASDELIEELINVEVLNQAAALKDSSGVETSNKPVIQSERKKVAKHKLKLKLW